MVFDVRFFPGFPLPVHDYAELMVELTRYEGPAQRVVIAHSLGALEALFFKPGEDVSMVLLAPSTLDKPRRGRVLVRGCLRGLSWLPVAGEAIAGFCESTPTNVMPPSLLQVLRCPWGRPPTVFILRRPKYQGPTAAPAPWFAPPRIPGIRRSCDWPKSWGPPCGGSRVGTCSR
ncbi:hypothetical protein GCM10025781_08190 [Kocuria gwangalliensis]|uniref:Alpha/beta hydrolase family protein n=1 Tax=Kocuria gwangalliensis TaxID=501592 RepID=A0ABP8WTA1_9MICC